MSQYLLFVFVYRINDIPVDNKIIPPTINQNNYAVHQQQIGFHRQLSYGRPMFSALPPQYSFQNGFNVPCIPLQTPDQMYRNQIVPVNNIISQVSTVYLFLYEIFTNVYLQTLKQLLDMC